MSKPRVLLADDHTMLLEAFQKLLADECDVVGAVSDGRTLVTAAATLRPDVIVVDVAMPLLNGIDATRQIKQAQPDARIIVLTMNEDPEVAAEAFRAGACGYLLKRSAASELMTAILEAMQHRSYITPLVTERLVDSLLRTPEARSRELTPRQREIVQLVAEGRSMKEVASILSIAPRTVAFHKYRIMEQLHLETTAELIKFAIRNHIV
ncbi:MAG TPA: response regulator transcription factor [Vicinamibacterales bacterium]|jgi:DNA-binding NarL/FixJ family response regulator|nr:response regulator transcription factor [Vicinamibacterales bacterium]